MACPVFTLSVFLSLSSLGTKEVAFKKMFAKVSCFDQSLGGVCEE